MSNITTEEKSPEKTLQSRFDPCDMCEGHNRYIKKFKIYGTNIMFNMCANCRCTSDQHDKTPNDASFPFEQVNLSTLEESKELSENFIFTASSTESFVFYGWTELSTWAKTKNNLSEFRFSEWCNHKNLDTMYIETNGPKWVKHRRDLIIYHPTNRAKCFKMTDISLGSPTYEQIKQQYEKIYTTIEWKPKNPAKFWVEYANNINKKAQSLLELYESIVSKVEEIEKLKNKHD